MLYLRLNIPKQCLSSLFVSLSSLLDRRGFVESDVPQLAPPTNGITMYGATQSQQSHMVRRRPHSLSFFSSALLTHAAASRNSPKNFHGWVMYEWEATGVDFPEKQNGSSSF